MHRLGVIASSQATSGFDVVNTPSWAQLWWANGPAFTGKGYSDGAAINDDIPSEVSGADQAQAITANQFTHQATAGPNSTSCWRSDGTNDFHTCSFTTITQPFTIATIMKFSGSFDSSAEFGYDGNDSTNRAILRHHSDSGGKFGIYGGSWLEDTPGDSDWHLFVAVHDGVSSVLEVDTVPHATGDAGTRSIDGLTLLARHDGSAIVTAGDQHLVAVYDGDARSQSWWADFEAWVSDTTGLI